jgi:hypothetical protein
LGYNSNSAGSAFSNNTGVGSHVICSASNQVRIGNSEVTSIGGFADWTNVSDGRFKQDVAENVPGLDFITALRPVTYTMDAEAIGIWMEKNFGTRDAVSSTGIPRETAVVQSGFIAQEVEVAAAALGYQFSGIDAPKNDSDYYGLRYGIFVVPLVKAVQELAHENDELREQLSLQQSQIYELRALVESLRQ